jgi:hypothetical protein
VAAPQKADGVAVEGRVRDVQSRGAAGQVGRVSGEARGCGDRVEGSGGTCKAGRVHDV